MKTQARNYAQTGKSLGRLAKPDDFHAEFWQIRESKLGRRGATRALNLNKNKQSKVKFKM